MPYVTKAQATAASRSSWGTRSVAENQMTKSASTPITTNFQVFLSHAYEDAEVIAGIKVLIERSNKRALAFTSTGSRTPRLIAAA